MKISTVALLAIALSHSVAAEEVPLFNDLPAANVRDISLSPDWHVYVQSWHGIRYIRIDDANHVIRAGIAASEGPQPVFVPLPIGVDADRIQIAGTANGPVSIAHDATGWQIQTQAARMCKDAGECSGIRGLVSPAPVTVLCGGAGECSGIMRR